jgi:hypothetical protein
MLDYHVVRVSILFKSKKNQSGQIIGVESNLTTMKWFHCLENSQKLLAKF